MPSIWHRQLAAVDRIPAWRRRHTRPRVISLDPALLHSVARRDSSGGTYIQCTAQWICIAVDMCTTYPSPATPLTHTCLVSSGASKQAVHGVRLINKASPPPPVSESAELGADTPQG